MSEWKDISSAPKDGTYIRARNPEGNEHIIKWGTWVWANGSTSTGWCNARGPAEKHWHLADQTWSKWLAPPDLKEGKDDETV